jgi:hypothetical protein
VAGTDRFYLAHDGAIACRSLADGAILWERGLKGGIAGMVMETWLDAGRLYALSGGGVVVLDAGSGEVVGSATWEAELAIGAARLTARHVMVTAVRQADAAGGASRWELSARWVRREAGLSGQATVEPLGNYAGVPEVVVCDGAIVVRSGAVVAGWGGGSGR